MKVVLSKLPIDIQRQIPISIRSSSDVYNLIDLPPKEQELIREYLTKVVDVKYKKAFDGVPKISKYADFVLTSTVKDTIVEYLQNYFYTLPGTYPFDPTFGCRLKYHLQTRDTQLRKLLISNEVNSVVNALSSDLGIPIKINGIKINPMATTLASAFECLIDISVPNEEKISVTVQSFQ